MFHVTPDRRAPPRVPYGYSTGTPTATRSHRPYLPWLNLPWLSLLRMYLLTTTAGGHRFGHPVAPRVHRGLRPAGKSDRRRRRGREAYGAAERHGGLILRSGSGLIVRSALDRDGATPQPITASCYSTNLMRAVTCKAKNSTRQRNTWVGLQPSTGV